MAVRFSGSQTLQRTTNLPPGESYTIGGWGRSVTDTNNTVALAFLLGSGGGLAVGFDADGLTLMGAYNDGSARWAGRAITLNTDYYWALITSGVGSGQSTIYTRYANESTWTSSAIAATRAAIGTQSSLQLGAVNAGFFYNGRMWNVKCWDRALSADELMIESYSAAVKFPASLNFHWDLARHTVLRDISGNGRAPALTGTLTTEDGSRGLWKPSAKIFLPSAAPSPPTGVNATAVDHQSISVAFTPSVGSTRNDIYIRSTATPPSITTEGSHQWGHDEASNSSANQFRYRYDGTGVDIWILDTGFRTTHTEFGGRLTVVDVTGEGTGTDEYDHGTGVASVAGGEGIGFAKGATLKGVRIYREAAWDSTYGAGDYVDDYLAGLDYVIANLTLPAVVMTSMPPPGAADGSGGAETTQVAAKWQAIYDAGAVCVIAAGNNDGTMFANPPYNMADLIQVGGTQEGLAFWTTSAEGVAVDILAPAAGWTVASSAGNSATASNSGTSFAAPAVAGVLAQLLDESPNATPERLKKILFGQAREGVISGVTGSTPNVFLNSLATATDWVLYEDVGASPYVIDGLEPGHTYEVEVESWVAGVQTGRSATDSVTTGLAPVTLIVADATQVQSVDALALTAGLALTVAEVAQAQSVDALALTQAATLAVAAVDQAQGVDSVALSTAAALTVADATQAQSVDAVTLATGLTLTLADATQAQGVDNVGMTIAATLSVAEVAQAQSVESLALSVGAALAVAEVLQLQTVDNLGLSSEGATTLSVADTVQAQSVDGVVLTQAALLTVQDAAQAQSVEGLTLLFGAALTVADASQAQSVDGLTLTLAYALSVQDVLQGQPVEAIVLGGTSQVTLSVADATQAQRVDGVVLRLPVAFLDRAILFAVPLDDGIYSVPAEITYVRVS